MRSLCLLLALLALVVAGCGGDDDDEAEGGQTVTARAGEAVRIVADEYSFDPSAIVIEGARGPTRVRLTLDNRGALAHNAKVLQDGRELGGTPTFQAGRTRSGEVTLRPGRYELICTVGDHAELGMTGTLEIR